MIDVRRMQMLRAVVTSGSVTAAAMNLGYTPSAVSQQVAALEKQAGTPLLERVGRGVRPTAAGQLLTEHAAVIGERVAEAETALADLRAGRTGRLAVQYFASAGATLMVPALTRLRHEHPGVQVELKLTDPGRPEPAPAASGSGRPQVEEVAAGQADLALVVSPAQGSRDGIRLVPLFEDPYRVVLPREHPLAAGRVVDLGDLADEPWVGGERYGPCRDVVLGACAAAGFTPGVVVESEDHATAQGFVAAGLGVALIPVTGLGARCPGTVVRRIRKPEPVRAICAAVRETAPISPALRCLLDGLMDAAARHGAG